MGLLAVGLLATALPTMPGGVTRRRVLGLLAVGLLATAAGLAIHAAGLLSWLERDSVDARFSLRGAQRPPSDVVVVGIDNDSLGVLPRFPFSRQLDARVLENLHAAGARLVVYDISFDRPTTPAADEALHEAARRSAPVVFGTSLISPSGETQVLGGDANLTDIGDHRDRQIMDLVPGRLLATVPADRGPSHSPLIGTNQSRSPNGSVSALVLRSASFVFLGV